jgi:hypothetical protein
MRTAAVVVIVPSHASRDLPAHMATLNTTTADKIDALTEILYSAPSRHSLTGCMRCVWYAHKMMATDPDDHTAVDSLYDEWEAVRPSLSLDGEFGVELFWLADTCMDSLCPYSI